MTQFVLVCENPIQPVSSSACEGVQSWIEYVEPVNNPINELDVEIFGMVDALLLTTFFVGHATGRLLKWFGKG